jgi:hypothetical protein
MQDVTHLSSPNPDLGTRVATSTVTAPERTFAYLWARSGAPALVGYEASLLVTLARSDVAMYEQLTVVDLDDPEAVLDAVKVIQNWRRDVAAGTTSVSFGPHARPRAEVGPVGMTPLADAA